MPESCSCWFHLMPDEFCCLLPPIWSLLAVGSGSKQKFVVVRCSRLEETRCLVVLMESLKSQWSFCLCLRLNWRRFLILRFCQCSCFDCGSIDDVCGSLTLRVELESVGVQIMVCQTLDCNGVGLKRGEGCVLIAHCPDFGLIGDCWCVEHCRDDDLLLLMLKSIV